jgi:hypothetical protein
MAKRGRLGSGHVAAPIISGMIAGGDAVSFGFNAVPAPYSERPFVWFPLAGQRHAIHRRDRSMPRGSPLRTLCGATHPRSPAGDVEWLWPTCEPCWDEACKIVGVRPRR